MSRKLLLKKNRLVVARGRRYEVEEMGEGFKKIHKDLKIPINRPYLDSNEFKKQ